MNEYKTKLGGLAIILCVTITSMSVILLGIVQQG